MYANVLFIKVHKHSSILLNMQQQATHKFYNLDENPVIGRGTHQFEEEWSQGEVVFRIFPSQFTDDIDSSSLNAWKRKRHLKKKPKVNNRTIDTLTRIWVLQFLLQSWKWRTQGIGEAKEHFEHQQYCFLSQIGFRRVHL